MKWLDYGVLRTILLYRLGWDICILVAIGRWCYAQVAAYSGFTVLNIHVSPITKYISDLYQVSSSSSPFPILWSGHP